MVIFKSCPQILQMGRPEISSWAAGSEINSTCKFNQSFIEEECLTLCKKKLSAESVDFYTFFPRQSGNKCFGNFDKGFQLAALAYVKWPTQHVS